MGGKRKELKLPIAGRWCFMPKELEYCPWYKMSTSWDFANCYYSCWKTLSEKDQKQIEEEEFRKTVQKKLDKIFA